MTSVGRFYTSGNSAPTFIESAPTEAQVAHLGGIDTNPKDCRNVIAAQYYGIKAIVAVND